MRISLVAPPWLPVPPDAYGGTERITDVLARGLRTRGHDVLLHASGDSRCPVERRATFARALGTDHIEPELEVRHAAEGYAAAVDWGADVIHDHTSACSPALLDVAGSTPVVTTNHGPFTPEVVRRHRTLGGRASVVAISRHQASTAPPGLVHRVIHHGLDWDDVAVGDGSGGYALFLGRMSPDKGAHRAARAAHAAGVPLVMAAKMREAEERTYFEREVEPLLGRHIRYVGEAGYDEKLALLRDATCLLNPISWPEPFGLVMIEALACGTPVVCTPHGSAPEIVDHGRTGFLAADEEGLVRALRLVDHLDRAACRLDAERRFGAERMVADHLEAYRALSGARTDPEGPIVELAG